jgi:hypothetical protein
VPSGLSPITITSLSLPMMLALRVAGDGLWLRPVVQGKEARVA